jgi:hypothetical protein
VINLNEENGGGKVSIFIQPHSAFLLTSLLFKIKIKSKLFGGMIRIIILIPTLLKPKKILLSIYNSNGFGLFRVQTIWP